MGIGQVLAWGQGDEFAHAHVDHAVHVLELPYCPYGFTRADQQRPCDTAMDMDRIMFRRCGAELTIEETIPGGASRCRMLIRQL